MRKRFGLVVLAAVFAYCAFLGWRAVRTPAAPPEPRPQMADLGTIKSDLFIFARAERAFYASVGRYAPMSELRSNGLLSLPPDTRWPYRYSIVVSAPDTFVIVAMRQSPEGGPPMALMIDDKMDMREYQSHHWTHPERRHKPTARQRFS